jgi:hypothetical protein
MLSVSIRFNLVIQRLFWIIPMPLAATRRIGDRIPPLSLQLMTKAKRVEAHGSGEGLFGSADGLPAIRSRPRFWFALARICGDKRIRNLEAQSLTDLRKLIAKLQLEVLDIVVAREEMSKPIQSCLESAQ